MSEQMTNIPYATTIESFGLLRTSTRKRTATRIIMPNGMYKIRGKCLSKSLARVWRKMNRVCTTQRHPGPSCNILRKGQRQIRPARVFGLLGNSRNHQSKRQLPSWRQLWQTWPYVDSRYNQKDTVQRHRIGKAQASPLLQKKRQGLRQ